MENLSNILSKLFIRNCAKYLSLEIYVSKILQSNNQYICLVLLGNIVMSNLLKHQFTELDYTDLKSYVYEVYCQFNLSCLLFP